MSDKWAFTERDAQGEWVCQGQLRLHQITDGLDVSVLGSRLDRMSSRRRFWVMAAVPFVVLGSFASVLGAREAARNDVQASRQLLATTSQSTASTLKLALLHEQDLVVATGAFLVNSPGANEGQFSRWMASIRALKRYPELVGMAEVVIVPKAQLALFEAKASANHAGSFKITPAGNRPYYCFARVEITRAGQMDEPAGLDFCDTPLGPLFLKAIDTGQGAILPFRSGNTDELAIGTPVYSSGTVPATVQARRAEFLGWTGTEIVPKVLLTSALRGHAHTAVKFQYRSGAIVASFASGVAPRSASSQSVNLHDGWNVRVYGAVSPGSLFDNANALALLTGGIALSLLIGALMYVLATSRSRALVLVHQRTDELEHVALHDTLTGLPNRALILDRIKQMNARARRDHTNVALFYLDLDDFKDINDSLGHQMGDRLLIEVGLRLSKALRGGDTVGRLGGDEFVVLVEGASLAPGAEAVAQRLIDVMKAPFYVGEDESPLNVSTSIGIAEGIRREPEELLRDADIAMYRAKRFGKRRAVVFLPAMQEAIIDSRALTADLHSALERRELFLQYQPIVNLGTGKVTGVEALVRWRHPRKGLLQPDRFIPALESNGLIVPVGLWVLQESCRRGAQMLAEGFMISVSVNVSAKQLERDRIITDVQNALSSTGFPAEMLTLELTETTLMANVDETLNRLNRLKALGVRLAIDDFGTGYSSLAYVRQFPIDVLKIDQSFVSGIGETAAAGALVHSLVELGKALGIRTIAEGVETEAQRQTLIAENTDEAQGFYFARPMDFVSVIALLRSQDIGTGHRVLIS